MRIALGESLADYGGKNSELVVLDADVSGSTKSFMFKDKYPERFFNVGIAEPSLVNTAAGLAMEGKIPFINAFAGILSYRALEQIRTSVAYNDTNVKIAAGYAGVSDYKDGSTHHSLFDIAIMRAMPNMTVIVASDGPQVKALVPKITEYPGPVYLRVSRADVPDHFNINEEDIEIGKARTIKEGHDVTLITTGIALHRCLEAAKLLESKGISTRLIEIHTIKPLDKEKIIESANKTDAIITVEEHNIIGGLYGAVSETLVGKTNKPVIPIGVEDEYMPTSLNPEELWDYCGLSPKNIVKQAQKGLNE